MNLYLIRHGETDWNREGRRQGHTDIPLNDTGRAQSRHAAALLGKLCPEVSHIFTSPLCRASETARIIAQELGWDPGKIRLEPLLIERHFGESEGLLPEERAARFPDDQYSGMEPMESFLSRAESACEHILNTVGDSQNILIVSHYVMLSSIIGILTEGAVTQTHMEQGAVYHVEYSTGAARVTKYTMQQLLHG